MTDRIRTITVILDQDYREDDAEPILKAIRMVKGVSGATYVPVGGEDVMARDLAKDELRRELGQQIHELLLPSFMRRRGER